MQRNNADETPFSNKALFWLILLGLLSTLGMAIASVFQGDGQYETSTGTDSFSKSAIGHAAFTELLAQDGWSVVKSQHDTLGKLGEGAVLLIMEPPRGSFAEQRIDDLTGYAPTLLVLPKRRGFPDQFRAGWISQQLLYGVSVPERVLSHLLEDGEVIRPETRQSTWVSPVFQDQMPDISDLQLFTSQAAEPVIATEEGMLLGRIEPEGGYPLWILSDPDLLATHGLNRGWNADFAVAIASLVADGRTTAVVDEVIHGFAVEPSLVRAMFEAPFIYATVAFLVALTVFLLAFTRRFGAPYRDRAAPQDSKAVFLENAAHILHMAEKEHEALVRLLDDTALQVAGELNVPADLEKHRLVAWLDQKAQQRGISPDYSTLRRRLQRMREDDDTRRRRLLIISNQIQTWKREMLSDAK